MTSVRLTPSSRQRAAFTLIALLDKTATGTDSSTSYCANSGVLVPTGGYLPSCFYTKGSTQCVLFFERYANSNGSTFNGPYNLPSGATTVTCVQNGTTMTV